jgi:putative transposase
MTRTSGSEGAGTQQCVPATRLLSVVTDDGTMPSGGSLLGEIVREGARRMLAAALEAEINAYVAELAHERDGDGRRLAVTRA